MLRDVVKYIKLIKDRVRPHIPEEHFDGVVADITNVICDNWVNGDNYELSRTQVMSLVRRHIAKKYTNN